MFGNKSIGVLIPAYNEEKKIESIIHRIPDLVDQVVVVDDGSSDNTSKYALKTGATVVSHRYNQGKGVAIRTGIKHLTTDIIVFLDADGQHRPEDIRALLYPLINNQADFTIGSRLFGGFSDMPLIRIFSNSITSVLIRLRTGVRVLDTQCGFRAIFRKYITKMDLRSCRYEIESEILLSVIRNKLRIKEVPIQVIYGDEESHFSGKDVISFLKSVILG